MNDVTSKTGLPRSFPFVAQKYIDRRFIPLRFSKSCLQPPVKREDGSGALRPDIAFAKAWGLIGMGIGGRAMAKRAADTPTFWAALNTISAGRIAPIAGGVLILKEGNVVGSIGMSGDLPDNDEACCVAGAQSAGFETEVGEAALGKQ